MARKEEVSDSEESSGHDEPEVETASESSDDESLQEPAPQARQWTAIGGRGSSQPSDASVARMVSEPEGPPKRPRNFVFFMRASSTCCGRGLPLCKVAIATASHTLITACRCSHRSPPVAAHTDSCMGARHPRR